MTDDVRLSQLKTQWTLLAQSHDADPATARAARDEFLPLYCAPVYRYLVSIVGDADRAADLAQEFALRFVRGNFRHARPGRGRFRDYLKTALRHLVGEWHRRNARADTLPLDDETLTAAADDDAAFAAEWRREMLDRAWARLKAESAAKGQLYFEALRLKADEPSRSSADVAALLTERHGRPVSADGARQTLRRARQRFAELLRAEVAATLPDDDPAAVDGELAELGLLVYVQ